MASWLLNGVYNLAVSHGLIQAPDRTWSLQDPADANRDENGIYHPTPQDVVFTRALLNQSLGLPPDVVDIIFDEAEWWTRSSNEVDFVLEHRSPKRIVGSSPREDQFLVSEPASLCRVLADITQLRSFPVGLKSLNDRKDLADVLQYDLNEAAPEHLSSEHPKAYFKSLAGYPTPRLVHPVRKVVFTIRSKDQGWGGRGEAGAYDGSFTWFEAGHERFDASQTCHAQCTYDLRYNSPKSTATQLPLCALRPLQPRPQQNTSVHPTTGEAESTFHTYQHELHPDEKFLIQKNPMRQKHFLEHVIEWRYTDDIQHNDDKAAQLAAAGRGMKTGNGEFVRGLKVGDVVTVWGKARFPGWQNQIQKVTIDVYWAV